MLVNPTETQIIPFYQNCTGNIIKTIFDAFGNLYVWDGDRYEHREIMGNYGIPDEMYETANRIYKDFGGIEELLDTLQWWQTHVREKQFRDGKWV